MEQLPAVPNLDPEHEQRMALIRLARDVARDIYTLDEILRRRGLTPDEYAAIVKNPFYSKVLEAETLAFHGAANTKERVAVEAAVTLEEFLPQLAQRMHDSDEPLTQAVEGAKLLAKLAGLGESEQRQGPAGDRFVIKINLGEGKSVEYQREAEAIDVTPTPIEAPSDAELPVGRRIAGDSLPLQRVTVSAPSRGEVGGGAADDPASVEDSG